MTTNDQPSGTSPLPRALREWIAAGLAGLAVSLAIVAPFLWLGNASGHDFEFHVASWLDVASQWKEHIAYPRWHQWANHGFGEPRFIFYPPLSWILGAGLSLVAPWNVVPAAFIVVTQTAACLCAFAFARRWLAWRGALAAGALYAANPYALLVIYRRSDFAEQLASALLPLLFLSAFDLADVSAGRKNSDARKEVLFALAFAAIWLSNAPAGVLASYSMALLFAWLAIARREWRIVARGAGALALGLGLAGFYLAPAAYEQKWVNIGQALSAGLQPTENFLYTSINDPEHNLFNWTVSTIAIVMAVTLGVAALAAIRESRRAAEWRRANLNALLVIAAAATLLMLRVTAIFWVLLPKLPFVQFPWRWMVILAVPLAIFVGAASVGRLGTLWIAGTLAISAGTGFYLVRHTWWDAEGVAMLQAAIERGKGFEGTDEYDPAGDDHYNLPEGASRARILANGPNEQRAAGGVTIENWSTEERLLRVHSREPLRVALRLLNYPAWRVEVNGRMVTPEAAEDSLQMIVPVPAGDSQVRIVFTRTGDRTIGAAVSSLACLAALVLFLRGRRLTHAG